MYAELKPGDVFEGRYRVDGVLGVGGFSVVYDATDIDYERRVALKVVPPEGSRHTGPTRARFEREVAMVAEIDSPHVVEVYEYGSTLHGLMFAVFEHVPGRDLAEVLIERGRLRPDVVERILRQLLRALGEAHRHGILHRDLKPENIRVFERDGDPWCVKLLDFGIARPHGTESPSVTATGELIGTPRYMSPEQLTDTRLTVASDIYSLGVVAFELLAGRDALHGNSWTDQLDRLESGHLFSADDVPGADELQRVIQQMTVFEIEERLGSAEEVLIALAGESVATIDESVDPEASGREEGNSTVVEEHDEPAEARRDHGTLPIGQIAAAAAAVVAIGAVLFFSITGSGGDGGSERGLPAGLLATKQHAPTVDPAPPPPQQRALVASPSTDATTLDVAHVVPSGCGNEPPFVGRGRLRYRYDLAGNPWEAYIPKNYDPTTPRPLLMLLHDRLQDGRKLFTSSGLVELAEEHGFVVVAPVIDRVFPDLPWKLGRDVKMLFDVYDETATLLCIDRERVFIVAQGGGGVAADRVSCDDWVAGIATNSYRRTETKFSCDRPVPRLLISPLRSDHEPIDGGRNCKGTRQLSLAENERMWKQRNSCEQTEPRTVQYQGGRCRIWQCETPFHSCYSDGGRGWPGGPPRATPDPKCEGPPSRFPVPQVVWEFFDGLEARPDVGSH